MGIWMHDPIEPSEVAAPYDKGDWPDVGTTSWMVGELGRLLGRPVFVIHNDRKVMAFEVDDKKEYDTAIVYNVWGDHFMMYTGTVANAAAHMTIRSRKDPPLVVLATQHDAEIPKVRYGEMWGGSLEGRGLYDIVALVALLSFWFSSKGKNREQVFERRLRTRSIRVEVFEPKFDEADHYMTPLLEIANEFVQKRKLNKFDVEDYTKDRELRKSMGEHDYWEYCKSTSGLADQAERDRARQAIVEDTTVDLKGIVRLVSGPRHFCYDGDMADLRKRLTANGLSTFASWSSPLKISSLTHVVNKRAKLHIHSVPSNANCLNMLCQEVSEAAKVEVPYHGESRGVVLLNILNALLVTKRVTFGRLAREHLSHKYDERCTECGNPHMGCFEIHHIVPLADGGSNEIDNLTPLCAPCHAEVTERQRESGLLTQRRPIVSRLSPYMTEEFRRTPKPRTWLSGTASKRDALCLDLAGCRRNALLYGSEALGYGPQELPIFCPGDHPVPDDGTTDLRNYHWFFVKKRDDTTLGQLDAMIYDGSHWYSYPTTRYMIDTGIIDRSEIVRCIRATRTLKGEELRRVLAIVEETHTC